MIVWLALHPSGKRDPSEFVWPTYSRGDNNKQVEDAERDGVE